MLSRISVLKGARCSASSSIRHVDRLVLGLGDVSLLHVGLAVQRLQHQSLGLGDESDRLLVDVGKLVALGVNLPVVGVAL